MILAHGRRHGMETGNGPARLQVLGAEDGDVGGGVLGWGEFLFVKVVS